jgi:hypothetical protein
VFVLSCVWVAVLRRADHSSKEANRVYKKDYETEEEARAQQRPVESLMNEWTLTNCDYKNYKTFTILLTLQFTVAGTESSQFIFTNGCLATGPNNVIFLSRRYWLVTISHLTHGSKYPHFLD